MPIFALNMKSVYFSMKNKVNKTDNLTYKLDTKQKGNFMETNVKNDEFEIDIIHLLKVLWSRVWIIVVRCIILDKELLWKMILYMDVFP